MTQESYIIQNLRKHFANQSTIRKAELYDFYTTYNPQLNQSTFTWRLFDLRNKGILTKIAEGVYALNRKQNFIPEIDPALKTIFKKVQQRFTETKACIWSTEWLNKFMLHQPMRHVTILEVESPATESVFLFLKEGLNKNIFLKPSKDVLDLYISDLNQATIVLPLISKSPVQKISGITVPTIEKILVDLFAEQDLFAAYQGSEQQYIFNEVFDTYNLNITKLFAYANRRNKSIAMRNLLLHTLRNFNINDIK